MHDVCCIMEKFWFMTMTHYCNVISSFPAPILLSRHWPVPPHKGHGALLYTSAIPWLFSFRLDIGCFLRCKCATTHPFGCGELFRWTTDTLAQRIAMKWSVFAINLIISIFEHKCPEDMSGLSRTSHIIWRELPLGGYHSWSTSSSRRDKYHEKFKGNSQLADSG